MLSLFFAFAALFASVASYDDFPPSLFSDTMLWDEGVNCANGTVTDEACCVGEKFCSAFPDEAACTDDDDDGSLYCEWKDGKCRPLTDARSDVCCLQGTVMNACHAMFRGECPANWQVDEECCSDGGKKYEFLNSTEGKVCCNEPCALADKCKKLPKQCAPTQRSWAMLNPYQSLGFQFGQYPVSNFRFGNVLRGTGFGSDRPRYRHPLDGYAADDDEYGDDKQTDEITVDDLFLLMIEGLEKDSNVKLYESDVTSDPYLGKTRSGGPFVDHVFPDPDEYLNRIYGLDTPYGYPSHPAALGPYGPSFGFGLGPFPADPWQPRSW